MHRKSQYRRPQAQKITTLTNIEIGQIRHREYFKYLPIVLSNVYFVQEFRGRYTFLFQTLFPNISEQNRLPYISYMYQWFSHNLVSLNIHNMRPSHIVSNTFKPDSTSSNTLLSENSNKFHLFQVNNHAKKLHSQHFEFPIAYIYHLVFPKLTFNEVTCLSSKQKIHPFHLKFISTQTSSKWQLKFK